MECLKFFPRFFMFVSSFILLLAGATGLVAGVWMKVSPSSVPILGGQIADVQLEQFLGYLLMAAGPALVLLGLLGCCAAVKDSRCLWVLFSVTALMAIVAQAAGVAFVLGFPEELANLLGPKAVELIEEDKFVTLCDFVTGVVLGFHHDTLLHLKEEE